MKQTYQISFKVYNAWNVVVRTGSMRCKSKPSEEVAKRELEAYLKKKMLDAHRVVFMTCINETQQKERAGVLSLARKMVGDKPLVKDKPIVERTLKDLHRELFLGRAKQLSR